MVHFLRDRANRTILDVEVFINEDGEVDLNSTIMIEPYSKFLIENLQDDLKIMQDFSDLQELKSWYWSVYRPTVNDNPTQQDVSAEIRRILNQAADEYQLQYIED